MTTALYIRLSLADGDKQESDSVKNQRDLLTDFISTHPELSGSKVLIFADDDYTGLNLNRPGFQQMIEQTKKGEINCIVVKDFSRFARSSVDTNEYLELIFPFLNVRFISVVNNYDSDRHKGATAGFEATVPAIIAEMYSRDLSLKVKTAKVIKAKQGDFLSSRAPYGYIKSKTVRKSLEIDPIAAGIIKRIFAMAADGIKPADIARTLNSEGIDAPMAHALKLNPDEKCYRAKSGTVYWTYQSVRKYLRSEIYTGKLIYGKKSGFELGSNKTVTNPRKDWIITENAVPVIVSVELFNQAQAVMRSDDRGNEKPRMESIFARKVICGHCGYSMKRQVASVVVTYACISSRHNGQKKCISDIIRETWLKDKVLEAYNKVMASKKLSVRHEQRQEADSDILKSQLKKQHQSVQRLKDSKKALFEKFTSGDIGEAEYKTKNAELTNQLNDTVQATAELETAIEQITSKPKAKSNSQEVEVSEFNNDMMAYVKSIKVYDGSNADVDFDLPALQCN